MGSGRISPGVGRGIIQGSQQSSSIQSVSFCSSVIIFAMEGRLVREGMYYASKLGMNNGDYAFIAFELDQVLVERYVDSPEKWFRGRFPATKTLNDEEKKEFNKAYKSMLVMVSNIQQIGKYNNFTTEMKHRMSQPPFCSDVYDGFTVFNNVSIPRSSRPVSVSIYSQINFNVDNRSSDFERKTC